MITIWVPKRLVEIDLYNVAARSPPTTSWVPNRIPANLSEITT